MRKVRPEEAPGLLRQWESSGEPMSSWCARRGLSWYSLSAFKGWGARASGEVGFVEVVGEVSVAQPRAKALYRVEVGAVTIEVDDDFRSDTFQRLVRAVTAC